MHEYDVALNRILIRLTGNALTAITGHAIEHWHNIGLPEVRNLRADMLREKFDGWLVHLELQNAGDRDILWRTAEYGFAIRRNSAVGQRRSFFMCESATEKAERNRRPVPCVSLPNGGHRGKWTPSPYLQTAALTTTYPILA
jgi:hypothetical protein